MDYDGDGDLDLVTGSDDCCNFKHRFFLFRRGGDGQFHSRESIRMRHRSLSARTRVHVADGNGDGRPDVFLHHNEVRGLILAAGPLTGREELAFPEKIAGSEPVRVIFTKPFVTDWTGDGTLDLLVGMREPRGPGIYLLRGARTAGTIRLAAPERLIAPPAGVAFSGLDVADWNNDRVADLIVGLTWRKAESPRRRPFSHSEIWVYLRNPAK